MKKGFSLLEMLAVIAIVGLISGIAIVRLSGIFGIDMKRSANKFASTVRYIYNLSITQGLYLRLVCDLDEQSYTVDATTDPYKITENLSLNEIDGKDEDKKEKEPSKLEPAEPSFTQLQSRLLKSNPLPKGIFFKDIYVEHLSAPAESGKVAIHFFPSGRTERTIINLRDKDDKKNFSISINPITGDANVAWEYRTLEKK